MPDQPEKVDDKEDKKIELHDLEPEKDPKAGGKKRTSDPCSGGE